VGLFHDAIAKPNLLRVRIPATDPGVDAIEEMTARGHSIDVTLIFSLSHHRQVIETYLAGLERLIDAGGDPSRIHSVASFFVSRVGTEIDHRSTRPESTARTSLPHSSAKGSTNSSRPSTGCSPASPGSGANSEAASIVAYSTSGLATSSTTSRDSALTLLLNRGRTRAFG
jgi:Transaldolase/Fructose-6-phosphate aldolase